jgi:glycosyltransferase involved in cell wall biosynthesis
VARAGSGEPGTFVGVDDARANFGAVTGGTRVLLFTDTYADVNGPSRFVQNMADCARRSGRDLTVFTSTRKACEERVNVVNFKPVAAMQMPGYGLLDVVLPPWRKMLREALRVQPDVVHVSTPGPVGVVGVVAARLMKRPLVGVYHTDFPSYVDRLFEDGVLTRIAACVMQAFYCRFSRLFVRSEEYAGHVRELGLAACGVERLNPGVDLRAFGPGFREMHEGNVGRAAGSDEGHLLEGHATVRVMYCGRVSVEKNLALLARVWPRVVGQARARGIEVELMVVGDGPMRAEFEDACRGARVRFLGFRFGDELARLYASSDLFVFPSVTDTLGQVVLEAQASGVAAVVSDVGGPKEIVKDGVTGLVVEHGSDEAWVEAISGLIANEATRRAMGNAAAEMMAGMSIERSFEHFWRVHEEVAKR